MQEGNMQERTLFKTHCMDDCGSGPSVCHAPTLSYSSPVMHPVPTIPGALPATQGERSQRIYDKYGTTMLNVEGTHTGGALERKAACNALFQKVSVTACCQTRGWIGKLPPSH